jgi:hypothetical protein
MRLKKKESRTSKSSRVFLKKNPLLGKQDMDRVLLPCAALSLLC